MGGGVAGYAGEKTGPGGAGEGAYLTVKGLPGGEQSEEAGAVRIEQESRKIRNLNLPGTFS